MAKLLLSNILFVILLGCSTSEQKADGGNVAQSQDDPIVSGSIDTGFDSDLPQASTRQAPPPAEAPKATADQLKQALQTGNEREIESIASNLLAVNPKDTKALNALAINQLKASKPGMAKFILKKIIEIDARNSTALNNMGVAFLIENDEARALVEFKKAYAANSDNVAAGSNLGALQAKYRNFSESKRILESIYSSSKSSTIVANNYALSLRGNGDFKDARKVYEAALEKDSRNVSMLLNYAILMVENIGDKTKGQEAINRLKLLATDPAIMDKARQLEAKLK